ncbi:MAG TPA: serine protease [Pyrinomonadaceae bacterium]|nr:serine protease [Pyrinomonadaceae bacterium]
MKRMFCGLALVAAFACVAATLPAPQRAADDPLSRVMKRDGYTVSLDLRFDKKNRNTLEHAISLLDWGPNGYATGFVVGDGLVMTAYHVVSGDLSPSKKVQLGFGAKDRLEVKAYVEGCQATVLKVDPDADLALLKVCRAQRDEQALAFQSSLNKDERLTLFARPNGDKAVRRGVFSGPYTFRGREYWSAKIEGRDGFSGSPVFNDKAEVVGVFSGYDWANKLAVISPGGRAQKLLDEYNSEQQH